MLFEPTLIVRELVVLRGKNEAYRAKFRKGINIISGENSSGKSTILNLLVYGLGANVTHWSEHAKLCDRVRVAVELNGRPAVFSREIVERSLQGMDIFAGTMDEAEAAPAGEWVRYPYTSSASKISFSQAVFQLLNIPELETETTGKITLHQIFRLLYSDQMTPAENLFRSETFDSPNVREAIGRFLFGAYASEIYANELELRRLRSDLQETTAALRSIYAVLGHVEHSLTVEWAEAERSKLEGMLGDLYARINDLENNISKEEDFSLEPQRRSLERVQQLQVQLARIDDEMSAIELEATDSELFMRGLERKISALQDSSSTADVVSEIHYVWCPSCFAKLPEDSDGATCRLCKSPFDNERTRRRIVSQMNELRIQLEQSRSLQADRQIRLSNLKAQRTEAYQNWEFAQAELKRQIRTPTSEARAELRAMTEQVGYIRSQIEKVNEKTRFIEQIDELARERDRLSAAIASLEDRNERLRSTEKERLSKSYTEVADETVWFLRQDLPRQDSFKDPKVVEFSFEKDKISIDGQSYFSASSTVLLKNSFLAGFLFAAAEDKGFRHFRIAILDTLEDKGMEPERSQNFQRLLVKRSGEVVADHQLIFATAMLAPEFVGSEYLVGQPSTHDDRTLRIG
jgi:hypothetical protein